MINIPKGTKDVLPQESYKWHFIENTAMNVAKIYNFKEIRTPVFEHTELFLRGIGDSTDIVNKEMYTFLDKGERSITLKPEGTACVARSYIENGLFNEMQPIKMYYLTPIFRYERPQAGRLRQHHQFGVEAFGSDNPSMDAEVISLGINFYKQLGLTDIIVQINNIGCVDDRVKYNQALKEFFAPHLKNMCEDCAVRYKKNTLRMLDCKVEECQNTIKNAPKISDYLCEDCKAHFAKLLVILDSLNIKYKLNTNLVRGLDYYTQTVFEFIAEGISGFSGVIGGGGRYDNLIDTLGGKHTPAVGFGTGLERIMGAMESAGINFSDFDYKPDVFIANVGENPFLKAVILAKEMRDRGLIAEYDQLNRSVKSQFKYADKIKARYVITIGDDELIKDEAEVKNMLNGATVTVKLKFIVDFLEELILTK
ncbi:MAG: histidine--tRNA ligase [Clostridia bacterium]|jgi:histidyl-tRNA synthetase|nr:histidine--tRNA ligase [Clostridia bacterium]